MTDPVGVHYEVLGVAPTASSDEVRAAYRRLARQHHPDRGGPAAEATMARINEAYRVVGDPGRRAVYDAALRPLSASTSATTGSAAPSPGRVRAPAPSSPPPGRWPADDARTPIPWRLVLVMAGLGASVVLVLAALAGPTTPRQPDNLLERGSCVVVEANGDAAEVTCSGAAGERVVAALVGGPESCPPGTEAHRDRQGRGTACLERVATTAPEP